MFCNCVKRDEFYKEINWIKEEIKRLSEKINYFNNKESLENLKDRLKKLGLHLEELYCCTGLIKYENIYQYFKVMRDKEVIHDNFSFFPYRNNNDLSNLYSFLDGLEKCSKISK
jgi:hypothetical protein